MTVLNICICCISLLVMTHTAGPAEPCTLSQFHFEAEAGKVGETSKSKPDFEVLHSTAMHTNHLLVQYINKKNKNKQTLSLNIIHAEIMFP